MHIKSTSKDYKLASGVKYETVWDQKEREREREGGAF